MFSERKRFFLYMLYAWGLSLFLTFVVFILDSTKSLSQELQPGIGVQTCFLKSKINLSTFWLLCIRWKRSHFISFYFRIRSLSVSILLYAIVHNMHHKHCIFHFDCIENPSSATGAQESDIAWRKFKASK